MTRGAFYLGIITLNDIIQGLKTIHTSKYNTNNELQRLMFQAKSEYLIRDKMDLYLIESLNSEGFIPIREWKRWEEWGFSLKDIADYELMKKKERYYMNKKSMN